MPARKAPRPASSGRSRKLTIDRMAGTTGADGGDLRSFARQAARPSRRDGRRRRWRRSARAAVQSASGRLRESEGGGGEGQGPRGGMMRWRTEWRRSRRCGRGRLGRGTRRTCRDGRRRPGTGRRTAAQVAGPSCGRRAAGRDGAGRACKGGLEARIERLEGEVESLNEALALMASELEAVLTAARHGGGR